MFIFCSLGLFGPLGCSFALYFFCIQSSAAAFHKFSTEIYFGSVGFIVVLHSTFDVGVLFFFFFFFKKKKGGGKKKKKKKKKKGGLTFHVLMFKF